MSARARCGLQEMPSVGQQAQHVGARARAAVFWATRGSQPYHLLSGGMARIAAGPSAQAILWQSVPPRRYKVAPLSHSFALFRRTMGGEMGG